MSDAGSGDVSDLFVIATQELRTIVRTPAAVAPLVALGLTVVAVAVTGSDARGSYVPLVPDPVPFVEALVPLLAVALCCRAVLSDRESGELDVLKTFDVSRPAYVGGVYLDRGFAFMFAVFGPLLVVGATVLVLSPPDPTFLALNEVADSPAVFLRFSVLTVSSVLVVAAVVPAISAAARTVWQAIMLTVGLPVALVVGVDAAVVAGPASGNLGIDAVPLMFAANPNGASRPFVLGVIIETGGDGPSAVALAGFAGWVVVALAVAVLTAWRPVE